MSDGIAASAGATGAFFLLVAVVRGVDGAEEAFMVALCAQCTVRRARSLASASRAS